jgi:hypothetical protein
LFCILKTLKGGSAVYNNDSDILLKVYICDMIILKGLNNGDKLLLSLNVLGQIVMQKLVGLVFKKLYELNCLQRRVMEHSTLKFVLLVSHLFSSRLIIFMFYQKINYIYFSAFIARLKRIYQR